MIEIALGALLVIAVVCGAMWLNTTAPFVLAFIVGLVAGLCLAGVTALWLHAHRGDGP